MSPDDKNPMLNSPDGRRDESMNLPPIGGFGVPSPQPQAGGGETPSIPGREKPVDELVEELSRVPAPKPPAQYTEQKAQKSKPKDEPKHDDSIAGVVDTFEAIIIALILALTFRAFVVEAFVIPTGSMAPTLLGAHFDVLCPKCGYHFAENADLKHQFYQDKDGNYQPALPDRGDIVNSTSVWAGDLRYCPNCGYEIDAAQLPDHLENKPLPQHPGTSYRFPWTNNGDRILVMKYLYSIISPERYDVIVFKEPSKVQDNYIKRLIGLPGETIEIIDGDIYVGQGQSPFQRFIQRKPRHIQDALWQIVYDNDLPPIDAGQPRINHKLIVVNNWPKVVIGDPDPWANPWNGEGWKFNESDPTVIQCDGNAPATLSFLPQKYLEKHPTLAFYTCNVLGYNSVEVLKANAGGRIPVGDLHLETVWTPKNDSEYIAITLGKPFNQWRAKLGAAGEVTLDRFEGGKYVTKVTSRIAAPKASTPVSIAFNNVDHAVEFYVDGALVAEAVEKWSAADAVANHQAEADQPRAKIEIETTGKLEHLKLMRDLYYTQSATNSDNLQPNDSVNNSGQTASYGNPLTLGPDEFFALGDNSTSSSDGRMWNVVVKSLDDLGTRRGIVPRRYLLGKAFFVYWPSGYRVTKKPFDTQLLNSPLVPNTGEMRLIR